MDNGGSLGIAARLAVGALVATVLNIVCATRMGGIVAAAPWVLTALVVAWVVAGAARDDGGARKAGIWALLGIAVASACTTLFVVFVGTAVYVAMVYMV